MNTIIAITWQPLSTIITMRALITDGILLMKKTNNQNITMVIFIMTIYKIDKGRINGVSPIIIRILDEITHLEYNGISQRDVLSCNRSRC